MTKKHLVDILWYIGVWFIWGAISHWFFSGTRSIVMAALWILLFVLHEYLQDEKEKNYKDIIIYGVLYSLSIWMISWWLQHFLDSPIRSMWIIPIGYFFSYLIYTTHMKSTMYKKNIIIALAGAGVLALGALVAYKVIPESLYSGIDDHHNLQMNSQDKKEDRAHTMNHMQVDTEEQFIRDMIPHHQEAVDTSMIVVAKTTNPQVKKLAQEIIDAQTSEITMMQSRLAQRYPNSKEEAHYMNMMPVLQILSGSDLDYQYLQGMIEHHQWAIDMANQVLALKPKAEVTTFAQRVIVAQTQEITQMKQFIDGIKPTSGVKTSVWSTDTTSHMWHDMHMMEK